MEWPDTYHYEVFDGCWFNAKYAIENIWADKRVVLLFRQPYAPQSEEEYQVNLKVFFTDKEYRAGWRKNEKKHLLY